jgi:competence protein ComEC
VVPAALFPAVALTAGAAAGIAFDTAWRPVLWALPVMLAAGSIAWHRQRVLPTCAIVAIAFGCCGFVLSSNARQESIDTRIRLSLDREFDGFRVGATDLPGMHGPISARLLLTEDASVEEDVITLRGRVTALHLHGAWSSSDGDVVVSVGGRISRTRVTEWRRGRVLEAPMTFRRPARYLDDGVSDFERDAAIDGISLLGTIKSGLLVQVVGPATLAGELAGDVRAYIRRAVAACVAPHSALSAAIVTAVLIGDRSGLPDDIRTRLQVAGTYHVIAISGGNIAILTALIMVALLPAGFSGRRAAALTLACVVAYAVVVTSGPSVWRATVVVVVYLVARLLDHRAAPWQATGVAAALLAVAEPLDVRNAGFLLTFGATGALLAVMGRARTREDHATGIRWISWLMTSISASAAVEIVLLPVMAVTFSRVTAAGLVLNLVAIPAMALVQIAGLVVVFTYQIAWISGFAGLLAHLGAVAIVDSARLVEVVPRLALRVPPPSAATIGVYYAALTLVLWSRTLMIRTVAFVALLASAIVIVTAPRGADDITGLRLTMFDVGQGDALMLQIGKATRASKAPRDVQWALMVDTGGSPFGSGFDIGSRVVEPALWARGVSSIDALLLTHGDPDHIGGALPLIDDFKPLHLWEGIPVARAASLQAVLAHATASGAVLERRREGEELRVGDVRILVLHPPAPDWERQTVRNDDSVVLEVVYGDVALLLTGDIGADVERAIVPRLVMAKTRILKVAHHGSRTSTSRELLEAWRPQIALISCGRGNPFGHPAPDVLGRLEAIGARIYRTDLDGEITVDTDGQHVFVTTFRGEKP